MQKGREVCLAVPPSFPLESSGHFHRLRPLLVAAIPAKQDLPNWGLSDYPMVTEEAGLSLMQEPPHRAQPPVCTRDPSQRFYNFQ